MEKEWGQIPDKLVTFAGKKTPDIAHLSHALLPRTLDDSAGMTPEERERALSQFVNSKRRLIIYANSFANGVHIPGLITRAMFRNAHGIIQLAQFAGWLVRNLKSGFPADPN